MSNTQQSNAFSLVSSEETRSHSALDLTTNKFMLNSTRIRDIDFNDFANYKELAAPELLAHLSLDIMYPLFYLRTYPDLSDAFGPDGFWAARNHFWSNGRQEGRTASPFFDVNYYLSIYPDLREAFHDDYTAATKHWVTNGIKEGRRGSRVFDIGAYYENNPDVKAAYPNNDFIGAFGHWKRHGHSEGRDTTSDGLRLVIYREDFSFGTNLDQPHFFGLRRDDNRLLCGIGIILLIIGGTDLPPDAYGVVAKRVWDNCNEPEAHDRSVIAEQDKNQYTTDQMLRNMYTA